MQVFLPLFNREDNLFLLFYSDMVGKTEIEAMSIGTYVEGDLGQKYGFSMVGVFDPGEEFSALKGFIHSIDQSDQLEVLLLKGPAFDELSRSSNKAENI